MALRSLIWICGVAWRKPWEVDDGISAVIGSLIVEGEAWGLSSGADVASGPTGVPGQHLFVLYAGIVWERLPQELVFGSGLTCRRRLAEWPEAGATAARGPSRSAPRSERSGPLTSDGRGLSHTRASGPGPGREARHRPTWCPLRIRSRHRPLDRRANVRPSLPVPPTTDPLGSTRRNPRGLPQPRLLTHLPAAPAVIR